MCTVTDGEMMSIYLFPKPLINHALFPPDDPGCSQLIDMFTCDMNRPTWSPLAPLKIRSYIGVYIMCAPIGCIHLTRLTIYFPHNCIFRTGKACERNRRTIHRIIHEPPPDVIYLIFQYLCFVWRGGKQLTSSSHSGCQIKFCPSSLSK